jgi:hypothetical protein
MQMNLVVTFTNGDRQKVKALLPDFVMFERTWNRSVANFEKEIRLTDIAWIAWKAQTRLGMTTAPFEPDWLNSVFSVEVDDEEQIAPSDNPLDTQVQSAD